jgi:hypothetical protein
MNSLSELRSSYRLLQALRRTLPESKIYLLMIMDLQLKPGPVYVDNVSGEGLLFHRIHVGTYDCPERDDIMQNKVNSEVYAAAIADAIKIWAGRTSTATVTHVPTLQALETLSQDFDSGDPSDSRYKPIARKRVCTKKASSAASVPNYATAPYRSPSREPSSKLRASLDGSGLSTVSTAADEDDRCVNFLMSWPQFCQPTASRSVSPVNSVDSVVPPGFFC